MQTALPHQTSWVTVAIFALAGGIAGMLAGGFLPACLGICAGLILGSLASPLMIQAGYVAACLALLYSGAEIYTTASLCDFQTDQALSLKHNLPAGSTFDSVYRYLKEQHASHMVLAPVKSHAAASTLTADYDARFLLSCYRLHTKFVFDRHARLAHCSIAGIPIECARNLSVIVTSPDLNYGKRL